MPDPADLSVADAAALLPSWQLALRADRKSPQTLKTYSDGVTAFLAWCEAQDHQPLTRDAIRAWVADLLESGRSAATARARQLAVRRFASWLAEENEIESDPFLGVKAPKLDQDVTEPLTDEQIKMLLATCKPPKGATKAQELRHRRDEALIRLMVETGVRAGEAVSLQLADVDTTNGRAIVRRGKGGKGRVVPFGPQTAVAIDRYLRLRRSHRLADSADLWLGDRGKRFSYDALHKSLTTRARDAVIDGFHPHLLRHTAAHRWLKAGGSEGGLMAVAGWTRPDMLLRYTKARAADRAAEEARGLNLGDM